MDAEPILLPKIWQDRCHFRVRTRDAIPLLIGSNSREGHEVYPRTQKENIGRQLGAIWRPALGHRIRAARRIFTEKQLHLASG